MRNSNKPEDVLRLISLIKLTFGRYDNASGGCLKFHFILKKIYQAEGFYDSNHVISKIGENYYDIDGLVLETEKFKPMADYGRKHFIVSFGRIIDKTLIYNNLKDIE